MLAILSAVVGTIVGLAVRPALDHLTNRRADRLLSLEFCADFVTASLNLMQPHLRSSTQSNVTSQTASRPTSIDAKPDSWEAFNRAAARIQIALPTLGTDYVVPARESLQHLGGPGTSETIEQMHLLLTGFCRTAREGLRVPDLLPGKKT